MANEDIKNYAKVKKVKQWKIADALGISFNHMSVKLRHEWKDADKKKYLEAVDLIYERDNANQD